MAGGRISGRGSSRGGRSANDALRRLAELGDGAPRASTSLAPPRPANESGLRALGERMSGSGAPPPTAGGGGRTGGGGGRTGPGHRRQRPRWSRRRKVLTTLGVVVVLIAGVVGAGYAYLQYEWGKVKKVNCTSCAVVASSIAPFNVLLIGSDTRVGDTGQAAISFGTTAQNGGQHSDTIKIVHVDPQAGTAAVLSIPRDTLVNVTTLPQSSGLDGPQKINTSFDTPDAANGPNSLTQTIEDTFGIPINHFVAIDFQGVINAVQAIGGVNLNFNYPVRDWDCSGTYCNNNSGLDITQTGCQTLNGNETLALSRSRYYEYYDATQGGWVRDPALPDIGRITRQNEIIEALVQKAKSTYNPFTLRAFLSSIVNDITIDKAMTLGEMYALATKYHAFSPSSIRNYTLPTTPATIYGGTDDVQIVQEPQAQQMITQFLGQAPNAATNPPLDANLDPLTVTQTTEPATTAAPGTPTTTTTVPTTTVPSYDPTPC